MLCDWEHLPEFMKNPDTYPYWEHLYHKRAELTLKRGLDVILALILIAVLAVPMLLISVLIVIDSKGPVFFRQDRVTQYGRVFSIHKFRTMVKNADQLGTTVTVKDDKRITIIGSVLRRVRLDELPQLFDVLSGDMSFVGTRPEAVKYVNQYKPEYLATLLLPAGITSEASIRFKDEDGLLHGTENVDEQYINMVLPRKMKWNLYSIANFSIFQDAITMFRTVVAVLGKSYKE